MTCNGFMVGHLNGFLAREGGEFEYKFFENSNAWGVARGGGGCRSFNLAGT